MSSSITSPVSGSKCCSVLDLVAEQHDPVRGLGVGGEDLERLAADPERARGASAVSLRVYWIETSLRSSASRSMNSPLRSVWRFSS